MATNSSGSSELINSRDIPTILASLPTYKADIAVETAFNNCLRKIANSMDITDLMNLLKYVKQYRKVYPYVMETKQPVPVNGTKHRIKMRITFSYQARSIKICLHVVYCNRTHLLTSNCYPTNKDETLYISLIKKIEEKYQKASY